MIFLFDKLPPDFPGARFFDSKEMFVVMIASPMLISCALVRLYYRRTTRKRLLDSGLQAEGPK